MEYQTSPLFSARERAALAFAEEATRHKQVSDAAFVALREHFSEPEIVEIVWLNAIHNSYSLVNVPLEIESGGLCAIAESQANKRPRETAKQPSYS
jgi:alkylhydroperoxidase family enzyme